MRKYSQIMPHRNNYCNVFKIGVSSRIDPRAALCLDGVVAETKNPLYFKKRGCR